MDGKNKEREDEKETKNPYLNVKFIEPSMIQLFSLPRPRVFIKSLLPTDCELNLYLLKLLFQVLLPYKSSFDFKKAVNK